eukprot:SAG31_NODE_6510_length_1991_cov_2.016385_2_plen_98_part_00
MDLRFNCCRDRKTGFLYLGCFNDDGEDGGDLSGGIKATITARGRMTAQRAVSECGHQCHAAGYAFMGIQGSDECFCSNTYGGQVLSNLIFVGLRRVE